MKTYGTLSATAALKVVFGLMVIVAAGSSFMSPPSARAQEAVQKEPEGMIPSLKFKEADIGIVLQAISQKATKDGKHINIIIAPEVEGLVTVDLKNVYWQTALDAVLKIYDYSYEWIGEDIIMVTTLERLVEKREKETLAAQQEPLETVAHKLLFLDAYDVEKLLRPQLTGRGKITVLETEPQKGWKARGGFGAGGESSSGDFTKAEREKGARQRTKTLIITDTKSNIRNIINAINEIDVMPKQILIETRFMEVNRDKLKDIGFDYGTGQSGVSGTATPIKITDDGSQRIVGTALGSVTPSIFGPKAEDISATNNNAGLALTFRKYNGSQFEAVLHALEEDVHTNTLSAPRIVTLDGQEAYIMVGEKRPIIESSISSSDSSVGISKSLSYYQNLGIELNVVPQICGDEFVNMIIYPSVTSSSENVDATSQIGTANSTDSFPIIRVRETQTQVLIEDGETIAIGGLLKDVKSEGVIKVPFLGDIPIVGMLFQRKTHDIEKIDLIIFITVKILPTPKMPKNVVKATGAATSEEAAMAPGGE